MTIAFFCGGLWTKGLFSVNIGVERSKDREQKAIRLKETAKAAISLYHKHGFCECEPYYHNPMEDVIYMKKDLKSINRKQK